MTQPNDPPLKRLKVGDYVFMRGKVTGYAYQRGPLERKDTNQVSDAIVQPVNRFGVPDQNAPAYYVAEANLITAAEAAAAVRKSL